MSDFRPNQKIKVYPNGTQFITTFNTGVFKSEYIGDKIDKPVIVRPEVYSTDSDDPEIRRRFDNLNRSRQAVFDIALMNDFDYFVTFTFNPKIVDSSNYDLVHSVLKDWLHKQRKKYKSDFRYLIVAELHKSGRIHFHGLVSDVFTMVDSGTVLCEQFDKPIKLDKAVSLNIVDFRTVYNVFDWMFGFSTAIKFEKVDDGYIGTTAIAKYLVKYITKDDTKILPHYYYAGGKLNREVPTFYYFVDYDSADGIEHFVPNCGGTRFVKYAQIGVL